MEMLDDGDSSSDVMKTDEPELEGEDLGIARSSSAFELNTDLGEAYQDVNVGESTTASLEDKPACVEGDADCVLENTVGMEAEFDGDNRVMVEEAGPPCVVEGTEHRVASEEVQPPVVVGMIDQEIVSDYLVIEPVGGEFLSGHTDQRTLKPEHESKDEVEEKRIDDPKEDMFVGREGNVHGFSDSKVALHSVVEKDEGELACFVDTKAKMVHGEVIFPELQIDGAEGKTLLDPQIEIQAREKCTTSVAEVGSAGQQLSVLPLLGNEDIERTSLEFDALECISGKDLGDAGKIVDAVGKNGVLDESSNVKYVPDVMLDGDESYKEVANHAFDVDVGSLEKPISIHGSLTGGDTEPGIPFSNMNHAHKLSVDMEYNSGDYREDNFVAEDGGSDLRTRILVDDKVDVESQKESTLVRNVNTVETSEGKVAEEELLSRKLNVDMESAVKLETGDNVVESKLNELEDAKVETYLSVEVANEILDEDIKLETEETASDVDEPGQSMYDSSVAPVDEEDETMAGEEEIGTQDTEMETEADVNESGQSTGGKRKRGRSSKIASSSKTIAKSASRKKVGEEVCFICFDGGELVLCDRRGCPKAYHPSCVNRDEAFFRSKGRWNCGWHLCSICEKNARYMCYTCTYSLCKSCIKDEEFFCVRENKGFCETCMRTVALIEHPEKGSDDDEVDFDDKNSWEYLFKDYYTKLKSKLSLSPTEVAEAKNPWKGTDTTGTSRQDSSEGQEDVNDGGSGSDNSAVNTEPVKPKRKKVRKHKNGQTKKEDFLSARNRDASLSADWASKELLEFVSHMRNGDLSVLSPLDVQALLLEYIKRNKLRDPRRKSQIICDARLGNLFGKTRVGHIEMLKLLESHFLLKDERNDDVQGSVVDTENLLLENDGNMDTVQKAVKDKKNKSRKKGNKPQSNLDDYAAVDMHNIGLIYLCRKLMEDLLQDAETFPDKVIGTFVRIRISGSNQKQDMYRLVQVVGTSRAPELYKSGKKTTDIMVEILNLDKTETISIDTISNQDFSEEECKRLRQSIKCGLINPLTVGVILDKTMELQAIRVNDWLESETLRLSHLCDRASDMGRRKELRECVEKLQLLKTPEERRRRLEEIPKIHVDPKMDPNYVSEDNDSESESAQPETFMRSGSNLSSRARGFVSSRGDISSKESWSSPGKVSSRSLESSRKLSGSSYLNNTSHDEMMYENYSSLGRERETHHSGSLGKVKSAATPESAELAHRSAARSGSVSASTSGAGESTAKINESEKIWNYIDPSGKVQGPFSMVQLRKWNNTGYFPADLRIWRSKENQSNAFLLSDALAGKFPRELPFVDNIFSATDTLHSSQRLVDPSVRSSGISSNQDRERSQIDLHSLSNEKLSQNGSGVLLSPAPRQITSRWSAQDGGVLTAALVPSSPVLPNIGSQSPLPASVLAPAVQTATFSAAPNSNSVTLSSSAVSLLAQAISVATDPRLVQPAKAVQPDQNAITQNPPAENQAWGTGPPPAQTQPQPQPQPQGYNWSAPSFQNLGSASAVQPDAWRPTQGSQQAPPPGPAQNSASMGMGPENSTAGWGPMQANMNMGWMNPAPGNANMNWAPSGNPPAGWVPPGGNPVPGNAPPNPGWAPNQGWGPPVQGPGSGWGNAGGPPPPPPPPHGNANQTWAPPPSEGQSSWSGDQNYNNNNNNGGQFSGQRGGQPWNRPPSSSFGGGGGVGSRFKRDTVCPYNANGRCKKGARCDYLHV